MSAGGANTKGHQSETEIHLTALGHGFTQFFPQYELFYLSFEEPAVGWKYLTKQVQTRHQSVSRTFGRYSTWRLAKLIRASGTEWHR